MSRELTAPNLLEAKLRGLVRSSTGNEIELHDAPGTAGGIVVSDDGSSQQGFLLAYDREPARSVGPAITWAERAGLDSLVLLADADVSGDLARRAAAFDAGSIDLTVLAVDGTTTSPAEPAALGVPPMLEDDELAFAAVMEEAGAAVVDDHGRLVAEYAGLEVARVTRNLDGVAELEVGVGQADRELQALVHGQMARRDALVRAIELVAEHRRPGAPMHPLNRLARERWLRSILVDAPSLTGCVELTSVPPLLARSTLLGMVPCAAAGVRPDGTNVVVVCSVGIELDLVADGLDYRARYDQQRDDAASQTELVLVMPRRDIHPVIGGQAAHASGVSITSIDEPWAA